MKVKRVMRYDPTAKLFRVGRIVWECGTVGDGRGHSTKVSLGLCPRLFGWQSEFNGWIVTLLGVRVHWCKSYGGRFV